MIATHKLKRWYLIHKWTSLICTAFLLLLCVTGLPLVFSDEINGWLEPHHYAVLPPDTPAANVDRMVEASRAMYPGQVVASLFIDDDEPQVMVWMVPSFEAMRNRPASMHPVRFDARTAQVLEASPVGVGQRRTFIDIMLDLHRGLFLDLPGELFLGLMALLFVIAIVSGVVLYGPFMKKLPFGTVREGRSERVKWLDLHNMLGIVVMAWTFVVGITGVMNELSTPLFGLWQRTDVQALLASYHGRTAAGQDKPSSVQAALETARHAVPGMNIISIAFPGNPFGSPYHYVLWSKGDSSLTSRLFTPVLVDASTGQLSAVVKMPWYLRALEVSRPLHFGDYGGMPLKILWAVLDLITIVVLGSGLYLWLARRRHQSERLTRIVMAHERQGLHEVVHES
jgi:uncharacterized iron-regulated membrane protein